MLLAEEPYGIGYHLSLGQLYPVGGQNPDPLRRLSRATSARYCRDASGASDSSKEKADLLCPAELVALMVVAQDWKVGWENESASSGKPLPLMYQHPRVETASVGGVNADRREQSCPLGRRRSLIALGHEGSPSAELSELEIPWSLWKSALPVQLLVPHHLESWMGAPG